MFLSAVTFSAQTFLVSNCTWSKRVDRKSLGLGGNRLAPTDGMLRLARITTMCLAAGILLSAQIPNPTQQAPNPTRAAPERLEPTPIFRIEVVARTTQAVNYLHRGGSTRIDFQGTPLMAMARGSATVESERGVTRVSAELKDLAQPAGFGPEYLTYVLWAISPDGRPVNLGELTLDH